MTDTCSVSDLVDLKDIMQALNNVYNVARKCAELGLPHPPSVALEVWIANLICYSGEG